MLYALRHKESGRMLRVFANDWADGSSFLQVSQLSAYAMDGTCVYAAESIEEVRKVLDTGWVVGNDVALECDPDDLEIVNLHLEN